MIFLMRHSQASPSDYKTPDDSRWLTREGRALAHIAGSALLSQAQNDIDCIVSSPCCRTLQTAEIVAQCFGWQEEIRVLDSLRSEGSAQGAVDELQALPFARILALSHEPIVSVMSALLSGQTIAGIKQGFRTAEIRCHAGANQTWQWKG